MSMRASAVDSSAKYTDGNGVALNLTGVSVGVGGDGIKLGGARRVLNALGNLLACGSPLVSRHV